MPCFQRLQARARNLRMSLPENITDKDVQEAIGAMDHDEAHVIINAMSDDDIARVVERLWARKRRKSQVMEAVA